MPHTKRYSILKVPAWQIFYHLLSFFCPTTRRNIPWLSPCFSTAAAAAAPSASHPRRPRRDAAACGGSERPCRRGRAADPCGGHGGRGRQQRPWPRKGFRVVLGVALTRWWKDMEEVCTLAGDFRAWSHICLWNCDRCMVWNNFWQQSCQIFSLPAVECSDFIFVAGMYPEIEKKEKKWKTHGILQRTAVRHWLSPNLTRPNIENSLKTQHDKCSACHGLGHLGQSHWIFRCPRHASIIFFKIKTSSTFPVIMRLVYSVLFSLVIPKESYFLLFLNLRKRSICTWIVQSYSWTIFLTRDTWCCESQVQLLARFKQHDRARTYFAMISPLVFRHASQCLTLKHTKSISLADLLSSSIYIWPIQKYLPNHPEKHPMTIRLVSRRQQQPPRLPRRILGARGWTALHRAADRGRAAVVEQLIHAGATVDAADNDGRGPGRVFGSFWEWLWRGDGRGSYVWQVIFSCALACWVVSVLAV